MAQYNWQRKDWPNFTYSIESVEDELLLFAEKSGKVSGILNALPPDIKMEAIIDMMVSEAINTSEIEGEYLSRKDVLSSIKKNMGLQGSLEKITSLNGLMILVRVVKMKLKEVL